MNDDLVGQINQRGLKFKILCEVVRKVLSQNLTDVQRKYLETFSSLIEQTNCFVFKELTSSVCDVSDDWDQIDLPFKTCSFETLDPKDVITEMPVSGSPMLTACLWVHEIDPENFLLCALEFNDGAVSPSIWMEGPESKGVASLMPLVRELCGSLSKNSLGLENKRPYIKTGFGRRKGSSRPKQIVHVVPKKEKESAKGIYASTLDWSHRWEVRGHWRKADSIGKNRDGEYQVKGFTWVTPHTRGPEGKPLIKKTRIVENLL